MEFIVADRILVWSGFSVDEAFNEVDYKCSKARA
jgi:hypothetical protein